MHRNTLIAIIKTLVFAVIIGTPLLYFPWGVYPYIIVKQSFFQALIEVMFALWAILAYTTPKYRPRKTPLLIAGGVFLMVLSLAALFGADPWRSFWSSYERGAGVVAFYHLFAFALILSSLTKEIPWKKLWYSSIAVSLCLDVIAFVQLHIPALLLIEDPGSRPGATFGNPTFLTGYLVFQVFLIVYLVLDMARGMQKEDESPRYFKSKMIFLGVAFIADIVMIFFAQTRGDIVALMAGFLVLFIALFLSPPHFFPRPWNSRRAYAICLTVLLVSGGIFFVTRSSPVWSYVPGLSRFQSIPLSLDALEHSGIAPRIFALRAAWLGFLERPILGWGPENYNIVFNKHYDPRSLEYSYNETLFDKPHNTLVEYLVGGGILLFLALCALFASATYEALRCGDKIWILVFPALLVAYITGGLFIFETIGVLVMVYAVFGMIDGMHKSYTSRSMKEEKINALLSHSRRDIRSVTVAVAVIGSGILAWYVNGGQVMASYRGYRSFSYFLQQDIKEGIKSFKDSVAIPNPYSWNFARDYAIAVAGQYFNYPGTVSDADVLDAVAAMESVRDEHPHDAFNHYELANLYNEVARIDIEKYTAAAERELDIAFTQSPRRQVIYFYLAKTFTIKGEYDRAFIALKKALDEDPKVPDAHFYYGILAYGTGDFDLGYKEIKTAIDMGREWINFNEARVVGNFFAGSGHVDDAILAYHTALGINSDDLQSATSLGLAYYQKKDIVNAHKYLSDVAARVNMSKLPDYAVRIKPVLDALGISNSPQ
ncbi:MAG: O-antigen ligase family protein [Patescibacteria group bacterium]|nr:O-antigen ligase family protein [Patescibacteria group bacterium]